VLKSIAARDPDAARTAMQRHLNHAYKRFSKGRNEQH
jgi:DNA-binding FadR family transcriptional regulator